MIDGNGTDRKEGRKMADLYRERVEALRRNMEREGVDIYLIPTSDYHSSEYVGNYFKERAFLTGFTGSAGTAVVARDEAGLWTDGRYFIQAERQLAGSGVTLFPMGQPKVPTVAEYVKEKLPEGSFLLSLLSQYTPFYKSSQYPEIHRRLTSYEYNKVLDEAISLGLTQGFMQEKSSAKEEYTPPFNFEGL